MNPELYMRRCFDLARKGAGKVAPNPLVGAVLVYNNRIIGEGYHTYYGGPHAEVNCINSVADQDQILIAQSCLYVNLEPCAHFGKTPPCAHLVVASGIKQVVIAMLVRSLEEILKITHDGKVEFNKEIFLSIEENAKGQKTFYEAFGANVSYEEDDAVA